MRLGEVPPPTVMPDTIPSPPPPVPPTTPPPTPPTANQPQPRAPKSSSHQARVKAANRNKRRINPNRQNQSTSNADTNVTRLKNLTKTHRKGPNQPEDPDTVDDPDYNGPYGESIADIPSTVANRREAANLIDTNQKFKGNFQSINHSVTQRSSSPEARRQVAESARRTPAATLRRQSRTAPPLAPHQAQPAG